MSMVEITDGAIISAIGGVGGVATALLSVWLKGDFILTFVLAVAAVLILSGSMMVYLSSR